MIKLIVSDLDGTLLNHAKKVNPRDREALSLAAAQGIELCLASGRMHIEMTQVMDEIGIAAHSVSQNGALIHLKEGRLLHSKLFDTELAAKLYDIAKPYDLVKLICSGEANYITHATQASDEIQARMFQKFIVSEHVQEAITQDLPVCKFSFFGGLELLLEVQRELNERVGDRLTMYLSDKDCLDIMPLGVSKGDALPILLDSIGLKADEIACIGDSFNDISMFGITPYSFAMHHGHSDVRKSAAHEVHSVADALALVHAYNASQLSRQQESGR
jgi:Cof subfamily protein (haloacid dehalogenase superfamily)